MTAEEITQRIAAIKARSPRYWADEQAFAEASALWAGGHNEHGVFMNGQPEVVARHQDAEASVIVAESPSGLFAYGIRLASFHHGVSYLPSIWGTAYGSREEARRAGLLELLEALEEARPAGKAATEEVRQIRRQLEAQLQPQQRTLFG